MAPEINAGPDFRIFALFSALNRFGYDLEGDPRMHPVRLAVRAATAEVSLPAAQAAWFGLAQPFWPHVSLMETYALHQTRWPRERPGRFAAPAEEAPFLAWLERSRDELPVEVSPGFLAGLGKMGPVLDEFGRRAGVENLWAEHHEAHRLGAGRMEEAVLEALGRTARLLGVAGWPFARIRVVTNLLQSRWLADQVQIGDTLYAVVAAADPELAWSVVHEAVHIAIRPGLAELRPYLGRRAAAGEAEDLRRRMEPIGYWGPAPELGLYRAAQEALVRAVVIVAEAAGSAEPAAVGEAARRAAGAGFVEVAALVRELGEGLAISGGRLTEPVTLKWLLDRAMGWSGGGGRGGRNG